MSRVSGLVIGAAVEVHRALGPGLMESVYARCLARELELRGVAFRAEVPLGVSFKGTLVNCAYRMDLLVEDHLVVELKAVRRLEDIHVAQLLTYLRCTDNPLGLLINFNVLLLKQGIQRVINTHAED